MGVEPYPDRVVARGRCWRSGWCAACASTARAAGARVPADGFRGRTGIHELLIVDDEARALVMAATDAATLRRHAPSAGMTSLRDDGFAKAAAGITTEAEVLRVTRDDES